MHDASISTGEFLYDPSFIYINEFRLRGVYDGIFINLLPLKYFDNLINGDFSSAANVEYEINTDIRIIDNPNI